MSKKILQLGKLFPPFFGGIESVSYELALGIKAAGHVSDVLCVNEVGKKDSFDDVRGVHVTRCASFFKFASVYFSLSYILNWIKSRKKYDVIHVHCPNPLANIALLLFPTRAHVVVHWHSDIVKQKKLKVLYQPLQNWLLKRANRIIATSEVYAKSSSDLQQFLHKISIIPIGIDPDKLETTSDGVETIRSRYRDKKIVFSLGRHVYYKGFKYLIAAAKELPEDYIILLGGTGNLSSELYQQVEQYGLTEKVQFLGKISTEELGDYYSACDVFCLPSIERSEAFGVVQLEAMSLGKPVVSTSIPGSGVGWVNKDGISGRVVSPKNVTALRDAIVELCDNPIPQDTIQQHFTNNFSSSVMVNRTLTLYNQLL